MQTSQTAWGLTFDTVAETVRLPENRTVKGAHHLAGPVYEPGNRRLGLLDVQRLHGTCQSWVPVLPAPANRLDTLARLRGSRLQKVPNASWL